MGAAHVSHVSLDSQAAGHRKEGHAVSLGIPPGANLRDEKEREKSEPQTGPLIDGD